MLLHNAFCKVLLAVFLALMILPNCAGAGAARETYFMVIFAMEGPGHEPWLSHTFATFVKATGSGPDRDDYQLESHTISWVPASFDVQVFRLRPEEGSNLTLRATLSLARSLNTKISMWGPYQIHKELYQRALRQAERLNRRDILYKAIDLGLRSGVAINCMHAVSDIDTDRGRLITGAAHGEKASYMVLAHLRRWLIRPQEVQEWVVQRLGLSASGIVRRGLQDQGFSQLNVRASAMPLESKAGASRRH